MRVLVTLLVVAGMISAYYIFEDKRKARTEHYWAGEFKSRLEPLAAHPGKGPLLPDEGAYFKMLYFLSKAAAAGVDVNKMISDAIESLELPAGAGGLVRESVDQGYEMAKKLMVFDDLVNTVALERGEAPVAKSAGWKEEEIGVGQVVPPIYAPGIARHIGNLQLMPAVVRDAQGDAVTTFTVERAVVLERAHLISREELERIRAAGAGAGAPPGN